MTKPDDAALPETLPLNAIRVFVETARQLSFSRAALALGMTQGGVSRHIATLERHLGQRLFARSGAAVELTDVGRLYFDTVQEAMSTIELATRQTINRAAQPGRLIVRTSLPTFAMTVLIPDLPNFCPLPPLTVDVVTSLSPPRADDAYDLLITRDLSVGDAEHWQLATETLVCVASPALQRNVAHQPIARWPFLGARSRPDVLAAWANRQGVESGQIHVVARFDHYFLAIAAALGGMGLLVVPRLLVLESLRLGHLVEMDSAPVRGAASYGAWVNPRSAAPEAARAFCRWLKGRLRDRGDERGDDGGATPDA